MLSGSLAGCGDDFLDTDIYGGTDFDKALSNTANVGSALNGAYYRFFYYQFAGNYATMTGDIASDISYWNTRTSHQDALYRFGYVDTDVTLEGIWEYGYKAVDHSSRVIKAAKELYAKSADDDDKAELAMYLAEAYAMRAYSNLVLVNHFGHQIKVNGADYSSKPGIVIVDEPVEKFQKVSRSTVGETYAAILNDLKNSIDRFEEIGGDRGDLFYFSEAAAYGLRARVNLYLENYVDAANDAQKALDLSGISTLTYNDADYKALYNGGNSNKESIFALAIDDTNNWSANSCGTLWSTYCYSPSPYLMSLYQDSDVRLSIMEFGGNRYHSATTPYYKAGKFAAFASGNPAYGTNYLINAPEMFLIKAEAALRGSVPSVADAQNALLVVAKRNKAITTVNDLPADVNGLFAFLKDERARELFQEGLRLWDLRRWGEPANVRAVGAPEIQYYFTNVDLTNVVFPIPDGEIQTGCGVEQTPDWQEGIPQR